MWAGYNRRRAKDRAADARALVAAAIRQDPDVRFIEDADTAKAA